LGLSLARLQNLQGITSSKTASYAQIEDSSVSFAGKERPCTHSTCHPSANVRSVSSFFIWSAQKMSSVVQNATGLRLGTWIGTSPCPRHKEQKKSLLKNLRGTSCLRPAATPGSVARELRLWKHHNKNYDISWLKLASITIELLTISAIS